VLEIFIGDLMREVLLIVEIKNEQKSTVYKCFGTLIKDIVQAKKDDVLFIFDKKINRLIKKEKNTTVKIDLNNSIMEVISENNNISFNICVSNLYNSDNILRATYKVDENNFELFIEVKFLEV